MIQFEVLWAFLFLPLPLLVRLFGGVHISEAHALRAPFFRQLLQLAEGGIRERALVAQRNRLQQIMIVASWLLMVMALAKPVWLGDPELIPQVTRDFMVAVDISASMETLDAGDTPGVNQEASPLSRLGVTKTFLVQLLEQRQGERFGLLAFGSTPYLQMPFTADHELFVELLDGLQAGMAGPKTMLGDAIGLAIRHFEQVSDAGSSEAMPVKDRVLLLITDGNDSGSRIPVLEAAQIAAQRHITIHTIAVGDPAASAEEAVDEQALRAVSEASGGQFFRAADGAALAQIGDALQQIIVNEQAVIYFRPKSDLFHWPLGLAMLFGLGVHLWMFQVRLREKLRSVSATMPGTGKD